MDSILIKVFIGHILGDFFFQFSKMANNKYHSGRKRDLWCTIHVLVYTLFVSVISSNLTPVFLVGVFVPHWIVDRWSLAYQWMRLIGRGSLLYSNDTREVSFGAIVYVVLDQSIHLVCLYVAVRSL